MSPIEPFFRATLFQDGDTRQKRGQARAWANEDAEWAARAKNRVRWLVTECPGLSFTAEDIRNASGDPISPGSLGALFRWAEREGLVRFVEYVRPRRPSRHGNRLARWQGVQS